MKIQKEKIQQSFRSDTPSPGETPTAPPSGERVRVRGRFVKSRKQDGFVATMEFIALLTIMVLLATANARALYHLHREVRYMEQQQIKRLNASETNAVAAVRLNVAKTDSK
jgi:hypothetical protein